MTDSKALIEQATRRAAILHASAAWGSDEDGALIDRLLAHIEKLEADNARLWEALESIVNNCGQCGGYGTYPEEEIVTGKVLWWDCSSPQCKAARAALQGTSHDRD